MPDIKLGSLFDGIGVFPLAASRCGIRPVWASEIEKAPISITKRHFPDMAHFLRLAERAGGPPPKEIEHLLLKQGGKYQSSTPFSASVCGERQKGRKKRPSETASDYQLTLFPLF